MHPKERLETYLAAACIADRLNIGLERGGCSASIRGITPIDGKPATPASVRIVASD
jgi:hypothetical protein